jgi:multidrug resistance efflux pump
LIVFLYWQDVRNTVYIENSFVEAPVINLAPVSAGTLNALYVHIGERVNVGAPVALVGTNIISSKEDGVVSFTPESLGGYYAPGNTVVSVVKIDAMKVVGSVEENKGLKDLKVGESAMFTVDAFPGKEYYGFVDQIVPTSQDTGVVFSISDQRPIKKFAIKIKFDISKYPELLSGMSAKVTVLTK